MISPIYSTSKDSSDFLSYLYSFLVSSKTNGISPTSNGMAITLSDRISSQGQYTKNESSKESFYNVKSSALSSISESSERVLSLNTKSSSSINSSEDLKSMAVDMNANLEQMVSDANFRYDGQYVFDNTNDKKPFEVTRSKDGEITSVKFNPTDKTTKETSDTGKKLEKLFTDVISSRDSLDKGNLPSSEQIKSLSTSANAVIDSQVAASTQQKVTEMAESQSMQLQASYIQALSTISGSDISLDSTKVSSQTAKTLMNYALSNQMTKTNSKIISLFA